MGDIIWRAFDPTGFVPRANCGEWTAEMKWLHVGSDLFIWLAYVSIPLLLLYFVRRGRVPFTGLFVLFALFILSCGFTHFIDALMFNYPVYRLGGLLKLLTAVVSWATVIALVPVIPRALDLAATLGKTKMETTVHRPLRDVGDGRLRDYITAILAAVLAVLIRAALDPLLSSDHAFVVSLLAVVFVSWQSGFGPGLVTLLVSMAGFVYFFVEPRGSWVVAGTGNQLAVTLFFFCGVACATLGESQRAAGRRAKAALAEAIEQRAELEAEVTRRKAVEFALRQREAGLRESEARKTAILESALDCVITIDHDGRVVEFNPAAERTFGYARAEAVGREMAELIVPPALRDAHRAGMARYLATGAGPVLNRRVELTAVRRDGTVFPVEVSITPIPTGGRPLFTGYLRDIADRKRAEDALRESEERFRSLADGAPALVWLGDRDRRRTYFNRTWLEFVGRPLEAELGDGWQDHVHPADRDRYLSEYAAAYAERRPFEVEYRLRRHDGAYRWVLAGGKPRFTPAGEFAGFVGLCIDVTDRKEAAEQARLSAVRFRTLTEAIPQMVWNADAGGHATYFNSRWRDYTGLADGAAADDWWQQVLHPEDAGRVEGAWRMAMLQDAGPFAHEVRVRRAADGAYRWFLTAVVPLRRADGAIDQWVGTLTDIDDQRRYAERLEQMVAERTAELVTANSTLREEVEERRRAEGLVRATARDLERSNAELEKFAYVASHDLQEPLRKIQAFGDRLQGKFRAQLPETGQDYVDRMLRSAGRMRRLIDDLLTLSRVTSKARPFEPVDLTAVARDVLSDLEVRLEQTGGTVDVGPLPRVDADPSQIRQLFQNLIANALKFHRPGVPPVVTVRAELIPDGPGDNSLACRVTVRDNGIGFDPKYRDRIFEVFQRLHGRDEYEGTGVGLAICRKIAERHGGTIAAQGTPGEGAAFVVTLPAHHQTEDADTDGIRGEADYHIDGR